MTHRVGVLVASELQQRRAVLPLPGSGGAFASTTLAFPRLRGAAAVLPRAHPAARRDVFLVAVSCGRGGSAVAGEKDGEEVKDLPLVSLSLPRRLYQLHVGGKAFRSAGGEVIPNTTFAPTFPPRLMNCLLSMLILFTIYCPLFLLTFFAVFGLMRPSNPYVTDLSASPNLHQHGLAAFSGDCSCYDCNVSEWTRLPHK